MASCVSAWFNREEFVEVYHEIFSNDIRKQKHALGRIAVWKSRVPKLPIAIENTAALIRASVEHRQDATSGQTDWESNHKLRNLYGLALIRFINHITETKQNKVYARSLMSIANELGLPEWLIELRHSATHNKLPSLEIVCTAVDCSLKYLQENFWTKQIKREESQVCHDKPLKDLIRTMLIDYQQCQFELIQSQRRDVKQKLKQLLEGMRLILNETSPEFLCILLEGGYLIPSAEQLEALDIDPADLQSQNSLWLPDSLVQFWKPLLLLLHTMKFTPLVVKNLMDMVCANNSETLPARLTAGWLMAILFSVNQANQMKDDQNSLYNISCTLPWRSLVEQALKVPTKYPLHLALWLLTEGDEHFQEKQQNHLLELINIYLSQNLTNSSLDIPNDTNGELNNGRGHHTVDDVVLNLQNSTQPESISTALTSWEVSTDVNWESYSLGCVPCHKLSFSNLEFYDICDLPAKKRRMFGNYHENQIAHGDHSEVLYVL